MKNSSAAVYVTAENQALADECAIRLAEELWARRDDFCFQTETYSEAEALDAAFEGFEPAVRFRFIFRFGG